MDEQPGDDGDTTYVDSADVGDKDTYHYTSITPTAGTVRAVQLVPQIRKTDAGARSVSAGSLEHDGGRQRRRQGAHHLVCDVP